jgi:hypothetical protein
MTSTFGQDEGRLTKIHSAPMTEDGMPRTSGAGRRLHRRVALKAVDMRWRTNSVRKPATFGRRQLHASDFAEFSARLDGFAVHLVRARRPNHRP